MSPQSATSSQEGDLAGDGGRGGGTKEARLCGRVWDAHFALAPICRAMLQEVSACISGGATNQRQEHGVVAFGHDFGGDGTVFGRGRGDDRPGIGDLRRREGALAGLREGQIVVMDNLLRPTGQNASGN